MHALFENATNIDPSNYPTQTYKKNDMIANEGTPCHQLGLLLRGTVGIYTYTYSEQTFEITHISQNGLIGDILLFSELPDYLGDVIAESECEICWITKSELIKLLKNATILQNYLHMIAQRAMEIQLKLKITSQKSIRDKIMFYLFEKAKTIKCNHIPIKSKEILANYLNIPRPSLSRELMHLKKNSVIDYNRMYIILMIPYPNY